MYTGYSGLGGLCVNNDKSGVLFFILFLKIKKKVENQHKNKKKQKKKQLRVQYSLVATLHKLPF